MKALLLFLLGATLAAADGPRMVYSKTFPGSTPAYVQVNLDKAGAVEYREAPDDNPPLKFELKPEQTEAIFQLAEKLGYFKQPLESPAKVAFMGTKLFRWENGGETNEVKFNYSQDVSAQALQDWFERIAESAQRYYDLERAVKYDKLGVVRALLLLQDSLDKKRLVGEEKFLPLLDRIIKNESYMHTAQERAGQIVAAIRGDKQ